MSSLEVLFSASGLVLIGLCALVVARRLWLDAREHAGPRHRMEKVLPLQGRWLIYAASGITLGVALVFLAVAVMLVIAASNPGVYPRFW